MKLKDRYPNISGYQFAPTEVLRDDSRKRGKEKQNTQALHTSETVKVRNVGKTPEPVECEGANKDDPCCKRLDLFFVPHTLKSLERTRSEAGRYPCGKL